MIFTIFPWLFRLFCGSPNEYDDYEDRVCKDSIDDDDNVDGQSNEATQEGFN